MVASLVREDNINYFQNNLTWFTLFFILLFLDNGQPIKGKAPAPFQFQFQNLFDKFPS